MRKILLAFLLSVFTVTAMAQKTILVVGDSLSAGYGLLSEESWPSLLEKRLQDNDYNYHVVNDSISGDTTSNGLARLPSSLTEANPAITIIELGGNDGLRGIPPYIIKKNLEQMIELTKKAGSKVLVLGVQLPPNYGADYTNAFQAVYTDLAKRTDISVIPSFLIKIEMNTSNFQADRFHPIAKVEPIILDTIWASLLPLLNKGH
jgi:acyl-CoA thioesterase-1